MVQVMNLRLRLLLVIGATLAVCAALALSSAPAAKAYTTSNYCGGWLGSWGQCIGAQRTHFAVAGVGNQYSVCVWISSGAGGGNILGNTYGCSGGAGVWVYKSAPQSYHAYPAILNNSGSGSNLVQGVAYHP